MAFYFILKKLPERKIMLSLRENILLTFRLEDFVNKCILSDL